MSSSSLSSRLLRCLLSVVAFLFAWYVCVFAAATFAYFGGYGVLGGSKPRNAIGMVLALYTALGLGAALVHVVTATVLSRHWRVPTLRIASSAWCGLASFVVLLIVDPVSVLLGGNFTIFVITSVALLVLTTFWITAKLRGYTSHLAR